MTIYNIPLGEPPQIRWLSFGRHGSTALEKHLIRDAWCLHFYRDPMQLRVGEQFFAVERGSCTLIPPLTPIEFHFPVPIQHLHIVAHFLARGRETRSFAAFTPRLRDFDVHFAALQSVIGPDTARSRARLWETLWAIETLETAPPSLVSRALQIIETRLHEPLSVAQIARELGVSHNHLTRSFQKELGATVVATLQERRVARATYLLQNTTLPIKAVGAQSGLGDFHSLNKTLRRSLGVSPRAIRVGKSLCPSKS